VDSVDLIIASFYLEVALWMVANRANLRSLLANYDVAAVGALPDAVAVA
jgi:hypothetical protein